MTCVKAEEDVDDDARRGLWQSECAAAVPTRGASGWVAGAIGGLGWASQELKPPVREVTVSSAVQLPLGWGLQAGLASGRAVKRPAEEVEREGWRRAWLGWWSDGTDSWRGGGSL